MEDCIDQMLEMEQEGHLYRAGRALRGAFKPCPQGEGEDDPHALLGKIEEADKRR